MKVFSILRVVAVLLVLAAYHRGSLGEDIRSSTDMVAKGDSLRAKGQLKDAISVYTKAIEADRKNGKAYIGRACAQ